MPRLSNTEFDVFPLCIGTSIFGAVVDEAGAFAVLDAYVEAGGNFIDTSDEYPRVRPEDKGTTEVMIGKWVKSRGLRDQVVISTKVGKHPYFQGLSPETIRAAAEASLKRLDFDCIDIYYAHEDDPNVPLEDSLAALDALVREGKVRHIAASNYGAPRLAEALAVCDRENFARFALVQPYYNMMERDYEVELRDVCAREGLDCVPYKSLAGGFLSGKYRMDGLEPDTAHQNVSVNAWGRQPRYYLDTPLGQAVLAVLDDVAAAHEVPVASVALAWTRQQPTIVTPLVSSRTTGQLQENLLSTTLELTAEEMERLSAASQTTPAAV
jgi:aryl-alcohol dehydrogenase-like predicted oxidoreductase